MLIQRHGLAYTDCPVFPKLLAPCKVLITVVVSSLVDNDSDCLSIRWTGVEKITQHSTLHNTSLTPSCYHRTRTAP